MYVCSFCCNEFGVRSPGAPQKKWGEAQKNKASLIRFPLLLQSKSKTGRSDTTTREKMALLARLGRQISMVAARSASPVFRLAALTRSAASGLFAEHFCGFSSS
jgi:hypothetical protein